MLSTEIKKKKLFEQSAHSIVPVHLIISHVCRQILGETSECVCLLLDFPSALAFNVN